jgi:glutathione-regulated potassium-efflux system ancillary protein KefC/glutathione-regulated potassium-efflux system protein KefB
LVVSEPLLVAGLVAGLVISKFLILYAVGRIGKLQSGASRELALLLSQGGEFAFVLFNTATSAQIMPRSLADQLILAVTLSMALTPILIAVHDALLRRMATEGPSSDFDAMPSDVPRVIIAGFGRFGQVIGRILRAKKIRFTALDSSAQHVDFIRRFGNKVYYGDAARLDLLRAAHADQAEAFVIVVDDAEAVLKIAETVRRNFPDLPVYARARNRQHVYKLMDLGVQVITRETFFSSLDLAGKLLLGLGNSPAETERTVARFRSHDEDLLQKNYAIHDDVAKLTDLAKRSAKELEDLFEQDAREDAAA